MCSIDAIAVGGRGEYREAGRVGNAGPEADRSVSSSFLTQADVRSDLPRGVRAGGYRLDAFGIAIIFEFLADWPPDRIAPRTLHIRVGLEDPNGWNGDHSM